MNRLVFPAVVLLTLALGGRAAAQKDDDKLPPALEVKPLQPAPGDDDLRKLQKELYNAALEEAKGRYHQFMVRGDTEPLVAALRRLAVADNALQINLADRVATNQRAVELMRHLEAIQKNRYTAGRVALPDLEQVRFARIEAEIRLLEAQRNAKLDKKKK
jgi:hypothetical protein